VTDLRRIVNAWYEDALAEVRHELTKNGFVTYTQAYDALQRHFSEFTSYYLQLNVDTYSEEFVERTFGEYFSRLKKMPDLVTVTLSESHADRFGSRQIFGIGERKTVKRKYLEARARGLSGP
jgi:hypothetical protein